MAKTRDDFIANISGKLSFRNGPAEVGDSEIIQALDDAVDYYSKDTPRTKVLVLTGDGTNRYSLPTDWDESFSSIDYVEFPVGETDPVLLDQETVLIWEDDGGKKIQFTDLTPNSSDTLWVKYTLRHTLSDSVNTIPDAHFEAVSYLGTALAALTIAGRLLNSRSETQGIVNFRTTSDIYKAFSQDMLKWYFKRMGINPEKGNRALLDIFDLDPISSTGVPYLTHVRR